MLISSCFAVSDLEAAVTAMTAERARAMREDCEQRAELFARERFLAGIRRIVENAITGLRDT
jgi:hypothetical protein